MLQETIDRILPIVPLERIRIVTGESMAEMISSGMPEITDLNLLTEPVGRNTCAAIGLAAIHLQKIDPDAVMLVLSADHLIKPADKLRQILTEGAAIAAVEEKLITIGIIPTRPETGYGYIKLGDVYRHQGDHVVHQVAAFTEKPRAEVAHDYYYSHKYLWNSGMFVWSAKAILKAIRSHNPNLAHLLEEYSEHIGTDKEQTAKNKLYDTCTSISIDFAVLENAENVMTIKADIMWDDVGGWNALSRYKERDRDNNVVVGDVVSEETYETTIYNDGDGIVACLGVSDLVIVQCGDITMVTHRTKAGEIKKLLQRIDKDEKLREYL